MNQFYVRLEFEYKTRNLFVVFERQRPEIAAVVHVNKADEDIRERDQASQNMHHRRSNDCHFAIRFQSIMLGYATDETEECMPITVVLAHKLKLSFASTAS